MSFQNRYRAITEYRVTEPELRYTRLDAQPSIEVYLETFDRGITPQIPPSPPQDLVSLVFSNQASLHAGNSRQLGQLILEREALARKHLSDIRWRKDELEAKRPLFYQSSRPADLIRLEQNMADLDRQKREVELGLWQDILELRQTLHEERREYRATRQRMAYLSGGMDGSD